MRRQGVGYTFRCPVGFAVSFYLPSSFCDDEQITFEKNLKYDIYYSVNGYEVRSYPKNS